MKPSLNQQHTFEYMDDHSMVKLMEVAEELGRVGRVWDIPPVSKSYTSPYSNASNKRASLPSGDQSKKVLRFSNGDTFSKVRGMINEMRAKVKPKFAQKNKKGGIS